MFNLSYQEKSVYLSVFILLITFGGYLGFAVKLRSSGALGGAIVLLIILQIVSNMILTLASRSRLVDERDRKIKARGCRVGYIVLITYLWMTFGYFETQTTVSSLLVINLLVGALVTAELSGLVAQLISYKTSL